MAECSESWLALQLIQKDVHLTGFAATTSATGQRLKKSTKITVKPLPGELRMDGRPKTAADKRAEAQDFCRMLEIAENGAKAGSLTEQAAKKLIAGIVERITHEKMNDYTAESWLDEWLAGKASTKADKSLLSYRQIARDFLESLGSRARLSIGHITPKDVRIYRDSRIAAGKSNKTANHGVKILSIAFNAALRQGHITNNPCTALEGLAEQTAERDTFTPEQVRELVEAAEGDWKGAILLAYYTGARLRDVANMRWNAIDLEKRIITFTPSKTGTTIMIPLHREIEAHLMKAPGIGKAFLFPSLAGKGTGGKTGLSGQFAAIMATAGIAGKMTRHTEKGRANNSLSFHSLRHSFNSAMANRNVSQEIRMELTGHASATMNKVYTHHEIEQLRAAVDVIPSLNWKAAQ